MVSEIIIFGSVLNPTSAALSIAACVFTVVAYWKYFRHALHDETRPNPWSWGIWGVTTLLEAITYNALTDDWLQSSLFYVSAACCLGVTALSLVIARSARQKIETAEKLTLFGWLNKWSAECACVLAVIGTIVVWFIYQDTWLAHIAATVGVIIAFFPIWISTYKDPHQERSTPWILWSAGDLLTGLFIFSHINGDFNELLSENWRELMYVTVEFACHYLMLLIVISRQSAGAKSTKNHFLRIF